MPCAVNLALCHAPDARDRVQTHMTFVAKACD